MGVVGERRAVSEGTRVNGQMAGGHKLSRSINNIPIVAIWAASPLSLVARHPSPVAPPIYFETPSSVSLHLLTETDRKQKVPHLRIRAETGV